MYVCTGEVVGRGGPVRCIGMWVDPNLPPGAKLAFDLARRGDGIVQFSPRQAGFAVAAVAEGVDIDSLFAPFGEVERRPHAITPDELKRSVGSNAIDSSLEAALGI